MKMKKFVALTLATAMSVTLVACGKTTSSPTISNSTSAAKTDNDITVSEASESDASTNETEASVQVKSDAMKLTVAYADAEDSIFGKGVSAFKKKLEELSDGSMTCTVYANGTLGSVSEVAAMVQQGTCDASPIVTSSLVDFVPNLGVFDLPFLFSDYDEAKKAVDGEAGTKLASELENQNLHVGSWMTMGFRNVTSNKDIEAISDFKGLKIRTQSNEVHQAIFTALGAQPTVINFSELYTAMEQGTVDAEENPYVNIASNSYYSVQKYLVETNHVFQVAAFLISSSKYNSLTDEQKNWVDEASKYASDVEWEATVDDNETAKQTCIANGMKFVQLDHDELLNATTSVYDKYRDKYSELLKILGK